MKTKAKCVQCDWSKVFESENSNREAKKELNRFHGDHFGTTVRDVA